MSEQNKTLVRRTFEEIWNRGHFSLISEHLAHDLINHAKFGEMRGQEGAKQFGSMLLTAFPDLHATAEDQIAEGDRLATTGRRVVRTRASSRAYPSPASR